MSPSQEPHAWKDWRSSVSTLQGLGLSWEFLLGVPTDMTMFFQSIGSPTRHRMAGLLASPASSRGGNGYGLGD
jgi:hypothetical protein